MKRRRDFCEFEVLVCARAEIGRRRCGAVQCLGEDVADLRFELGVKDRRRKRNWSLSC
eukprot:19511_5